MRPVTFAWEKTASLWRAALKQAPEPARPPSEVLAGAVTPAEPLSLKPWFPWVPERPQGVLWIPLFLLVVVLALPALPPLSMGLFELGLRSIAAAFERLVVGGLVTTMLHKTVCLAGLIATVGIGGLLLAIWAVMTLVLPFALNVHRATARTRCFLFGSFPGVIGHLAVTGLAIFLLGLALWRISLPARGATIWTLAGSYRWALQLTGLAMVGAVLLVEVWGALTFLHGYRSVRFLPIGSSLPASAEAPRSATVAHWSDLHLTASRDHVRVEGGPGGNEPLARLLGEHVTTLEQDVDAIILTGDVTDSGTGCEWSRFFDLVPASLLRKLVLVPGNHDVNVPWSAGGKLNALQARLTDEAWNIRLIRTLLAIDMVQGDRAWFVDDKNVIRSVRAYLGAIQGELVDYTMLVSPLQAIAATVDGDVIRLPAVSDEEQRKARRREVDLVPSAAWECLFPMAVEIPGTELVVLVLNSNDKSSSALTNAFGFLGGPQLERLELLRAHFAARPAVIALHHHLSDQLVQRIFDGPAFGYLSQRAMGVLDGHRLVGQLSRMGGVVLNGHRHVRYTARVSDRLDVVSASSTTLGDETARGPAQPGCRVLRIGWTPGLGHARVLDGERCLMA